MDGLLHLLHIADSAFPVGTHAHSYGLEGLVQDGALGDAAALYEALRAQLLISLARGDLVALRYACAFAAAGDTQGLDDLDAELTAFKTVREWRDASLAAGRRMLVTAAAFLGPAVRQPEHSRPGPNHAVAYGIVGTALGLAPDELAAAFAYTVVAGQVAAAVSLIPLGQTAAQRTLHALKPAMAEAAERSAHYTRNDMGGALPLLEIAGMRHERASGRLFIS